MKKFTPTYKKFNHFLVLCVAIFSAVLFPLQTVLADPVEDANMIYKDAPYYSSIDSCGANTTPSSSSGFSGSSLYILGDSITARSAETYKSSFGAKSITPTISAEVGRSWNGGGQPDNANTGTQGPAKDAVQTDKATIQGAGGIIVALGTNGFSGSNPIDEVIKTIREINSSATIWWVNVAVPNVNQTDAFNKELSSKSQGKYQVIDWAKVVDPDGNGTGNPKGLIADQYGHPTIPDGVNQLVGLVVGSVANSGGSGFAAGNGTGTTASCCKAGGVSLTGSDNESKTWNFLVSKGMSTVQAAGAMGNLRHEGNFTPDQLEIAYSDPPHKWDKPLELPAVRGPAGQPGLGIAQWTSPGRKQGLLDAAKASPVQSILDLGVQLEFLWSELSGPYKNQALDPMLRSTDLAEVTRIWQEKYEVGAGFEPRFQAAQDYMTRFGSNTTATTTSSGGISCATNGSGQIVGGFSLPLDRKFYDEHKDWFTKPHHDYPAADIPVPTGTPVYSMTAGSVISAPVGDACGQGVQIKAPDGTLFLYCHGSNGGSVEGAKIGDTVQPGQHIMDSASTGESSGPHLHLQIDINGAHHCPQNLFVGIAEGNVPDLKSLPTSGCIGG